MLPSHQNFKQDQLRPYQEEGSGLDLELLVGLAEQIFQQQY